MSDMNISLRYVFGARYRECRKAAGLTQAEAAEVMGIGRSSISEYETGDAEPTASVIYKMAETYGVSANYLLTLTDRDEDMEVTYLSVTDRLFSE